jgi:hypothetical protein
MWFSLNVFRLRITLTLPSFLGLIKMLEIYSFSSDLSTGSIILHLMNLSISLFIFNCSSEENVRGFGIKFCIGSFASSILYP